MTNRALLNALMAMSDEELDSEAIVYDNENGNYCQVFSIEKAVHDDNSSFDDIPIGFPLIIITER